MDVLSVDEDFDAIVNRIDAGDLFVYPTDTTFGIGASVYQTEAVKRVFELKERSTNKTVPVLCNRSDAFDIAEFTSTERQVIEEYWPGALTLVVPVINPGLYPAGIVRDGTIALRVPAHEPLQKLLTVSDPITGTSANVSGEPSPRTRSELSDVILEGADFLMKGEAGNKKPSTVAQWSQDKGEWIIHRRGPISRNELMHST